MMPRRLFLAGGAAWLLPGCATLVSTAPPDAGGAEPRERWERVLTGFVDAQGRVDFERLAAQRDTCNQQVAATDLLEFLVHEQLFKLQRR